jgi:hypothetical protein
MCEVGKINYTILDAVIWAEWSIGTLSAWARQSECAQVRNGLVSRGPESDLHLHTLLWVVVVVESRLRKVVATQPGRFTGNHSNPSHTGDKMNIKRGSW